MPDSFIEKSVSLSVHHKSHAVLTGRMRKYLTSLLEISQVNVIYGVYVA